MHPTCGSSVPGGTPIPIDVAPEERTIDALRRATRDAHGSLETLLQLAGPLSRSRYIDALVGFELFLPAWQARIRAALPPGLQEWFATRSRYHLLCLDLKYLGVQSHVSPSTREICEQAVHRIDLISTAAAFGSMYVPEGSALGGRVIARPRATCSASIRTAGPPTSTGCIATPLPIGQAFGLFLNTRSGPPRERARRRAWRHGKRSTL